MIASGLICSSAVASGVALNEIIKVLNGVKCVDAYKNNCFNLSIPLLMNYEPAECKRVMSKEYDNIFMCPTKANPEGHTIWDRIVLKGRMKIKEVIEYFRNNYDAELSMISYGTVFLYNTFNNKQSMSNIIE